MFTIKKPKKTEEPSHLEELITETISGMQGLSPDTEEFSRAANSLKTLVEARAVEDECEKDNRPSADQVVAAITNIVGIVLILGFEKSNVLTSKALPFITRPRI